MITLIEYALIVTYDNQNHHIASAWLNIARPDKAVHESIARLEDILWSQIPESLPRLQQVYIGPLECNNTHNFIN